jgi:hypothetical protein
VARSSAHPTRLLIASRSVEESPGFGRGFLHSYVWPSWCPQDRLRVVNPGARATIPSAAARAAEIVPLPRRSRSRCERGSREVSAAEIADPTVDTKSRADQNPLAQSQILAGMPQKP